MQEVSFWNSGIVLKSLKKVGEKNYTGKWVSYSVSGLVLRKKNISFIYNKCNKYINFILYVSLYINI